MVANGSLVGVKLLCETDFVSKNDSFGSLVDSLLTVIADHSGDVDPDSVNESLMDKLIGLVRDQAVTIGEAMKI
jgi:translation elongation factor EF-Ts